MINILLADTSVKNLDRWERSLSTRSGFHVIKHKTAQPISLSNQLINENHVTLVIVGSSHKSEESISFAEGFSNANPTVGLIWLVNEIDSDMILRGLRAGFKDIISEADSKNLLEAISRVAEKENRFREALLKDNGNEHEIVEEEKSGKIISIFSTKGGVGKSFIATNLAVGLAETDKKRSILMDLDLNFGDVGVMLQLNPKRTVFDLLSVMDRLDSEMLSSFLTKHQSGLEVLLAPIQPDAADKIKVEHLKKIFDLARSISDYIIIDTPPALNDTTLMALDESETIYLVATMDVPSIKNVKVSLQTMKLLGYGDEKVKLILNRSDSKVSLHPKEIEKTLEKNISAFIPSDRLAPQSINEGMPLITYQPKSNLARSLSKLTELVMAENRKNLKERTKTSVNK